jgi:hypothetical protein
MSIKVKFVSSWCSVDEMLVTISRLSNTVNSFEDIQFTSGNDYDYCVIFNSSNVPVNTKKSILFCAEPKYVKDISAVNKKEFLYVYDKHTVCLPFVGMPYSELKGYSPNKTDIFSAVISSAYQQRNHILRRDFLFNVLYKKFGYIKHWGNGYQMNQHDYKQYQGYIGSKQNALFPFKYTFNAESVVESGYFTEKIVDAILCVCLCFYSGDTIVDTLFPDSFIRINLDNFLESEEIIEKAIRDNAYDAKIKNIRNSKSYIINELNPLRIIKNIITGKPI